MPKYKPKIRLYINRDLSQEDSFTLDTAQNHYLQNVMRLVSGDIICVFDGRSGEYEARIDSVSKKQSLLHIVKKTRDFYPSPNLWLVFAPVKKEQTDYIVEKAVELGVSALVPVITRYGISRVENRERYQARAAEAAEQCRRLDVPAVMPLKNLQDVLAAWPENRKLFFMDETGGGNDVFTVFCHTNARAPAAVLIGPEGGFSEEELAVLRKCPFAESVSLGSRILRAETAAAAALSCWQALAGDWRKNENTGS